MARDGSRAEQQKADPRLTFPVWTRQGLSRQEVVETGVKVGDRVMAMVCPQAQHGAYREQIVLEARGRPCTGRDQACRSLYFADERPDGTAVPHLLDLKPGQVLAVTVQRARMADMPQLAKTEGPSSPTVLRRIAPR